MTGGNLPFYSYKTQSKILLSKILKNIKIARWTVSKQLFIVQIVV